MQFVAFDLDLILRAARLRKIVSGLQPHPLVGRGPSQLFKADGHLRGNARPFIDEVVQGLTRDAEQFGCLGDRQFQGLDNQA